MPDTSREWAESFEIFDKYEDGKEGIHQTRHDEMEAGPDPVNVSAEDKARLEELGWHDYGRNSFHTFT